MRQIQLLFLMLLLLLALSATAQVQNVDSLVNVLKAQKISNREVFNIYKKICDSYKYNDIEKFKEYLENGLQLALKEQNKAMMADFYRYKGDSYELYGIMDTSIIYYNKALELAIDTKNRMCEAAIYVNMGDIHTYNAQYKNNEIALEYLLKALEIFEKEGDEKDIALILGHLGEYHRVIRNKERANYYLQKAKIISEKTDYKYGKMLIYYSLGGIANNADEAIAYSNKVVEIAKEIGDKRGEIMGLQGLGYDYCLEKKEYDKAEQYAINSLQLAEEYGGSSTLISAWTVLSYVYLYQKRFDECKTIVLKAWETDSLNVQLSTLTNLAAAYLYSGELDQAHSFFVKYVHLMEKNAGSQFQRNIADMETKYETEKKELRIASLEKEKQLYTWLGIAGTLFAITLGVVLRQNIRNAKKEKQLIATCSVMDGEMGERTRLARDLHDRLSGNLSAVKIELNNAKSLRNVSEQLDRCIDEVRLVAHNLMPASLQFGMRVALEDFAAKFSNVHFHFFGEDKRIEERIEFVFYCCANEMVNNSLRHSGAKNINLQLIQDAKRISLTVQDDGCGFDGKSAQQGLGLKNIHDRVASCNGKIDISSSPDKGTETTIELKLNNTRI